MGCVTCGDKPKNTAKDFTKAVIEIDNPESLVLLRKLVIPASMGDDTTNPPVVGKYKNVVMVYEATGNIYLYSSDGIPTKLTANLDEIRIRVEDLEEYAEEETAARTSADEDLQDQIDEIRAASDVVDIVGTYAELEDYDTSKLTIDDIIRVLVDETKDDATTYYRWTGEEWEYIGGLGPFYTKDETDSLLDGEADAREAADADLQDAIDAEASARQNADDSLSSSLSAETAAREAADQTLQDNIDAEAQTRADADDDLSDDIIEEANARSTADARIDQAWQEEATTRGTADEALQNEIDGLTTDLAAEVAARQSAISGLATVATSGSYNDLTDKPDINDATLTIQKNGSNVATFTANSSTNQTANIVVPTKTSDLTNDGEDGTSTYAESGDLSTVATSGSYNDLTDKPTIPTVNNATLTIQENGSNVATFTANSSTATTANITVPTKTSDLINDGADGTSTFAEADDLATVATSGSYNDLTNKPTIPTVNNATLTIQKNGTTIDTFTANSSTNKTVNVTVPTNNNELTNGAGYQTASDVSTAVATETAARTSADNSLQSQIDALSASSDVTDIVGTYAALQAYDTSSLGNNDIIKVLRDESHSNETTYYRWSTATSAFTLIGEEGPYYTMSQTDALLNGKQDALTQGTNITISNNTISASYPTMTGAGSSTAGTAGAVPAPAAGDNTKYLSGDGTWKTVSSYTLPIASANELGGIKVGANLSIANDGTLSADAQQITPVQTTGTSTTDVMSQNAVTSMVFGNPSTKTNVQIGNHTSSSANNSVAIGSSHSSQWMTNASGNRAVAVGLASNATANYSVALGSFSEASAQGQFDISTSRASGSNLGYNSSNYRLLTGLYDPQSAHDAATKGYVDTAVAGMVVVSQINSTDWSNLWQ